MVQSSLFVVVGLRQCHYFWSLLSGTFFIEPAKDLVVIFDRCFRPHFFEAMIQSS